MDSFENEVQGSIVGVIMVVFIVIVRQVLRVQALKQQVGVAFERDA